MTDKPLTIADYQRLAMCTANSNPAAATPKAKLENAALGAIGESGEIAAIMHLVNEVHGNADSYLYDLLDIAIHNGFAADRLKKEAFHGHAPSEQRPETVFYSIIGSANHAIRALRSGDRSPRFDQIMSHAIPEVQTEIMNGLHEELANELGDLLWYLTLAADAIGVPLEEIAQKNVEKLRRRYPDGFDAERSRNRED